MSLYVTASISGIIDLYERFTLSEKMHLRDRQSRPVSLTPLSVDVQFPDDRTTPRHQLPSVLSDKTYHMISQSLCKSLFAGYSDVASSRSTQ